MAYTYLFMMYPQGLSFKDSRSVIYEKAGGEDKITILGSMQKSKKSFFYGRVVDEAKDNVLSLNGSVYTTEAENPRPMVVEVSKTLNDEIWESLVNRRHRKRANKENKNANEKKTAPKKEHKPVEKKERKQTKTATKEEQKKKASEKKANVKAENAKLPSIYLKCTEKQQLRTKLDEIAAPLRYAKFSKIKDTNPVTYYTFLRYETVEARDAALAKFQAIKDESIVNIAVAVPPKKREKTQKKADITLVVPKKAEKEEVAAEEIVVPTVNN